MGKRTKRTKRNTVWFREEFDGEDAAEKIKAAIDGWGTDEGELVKILGSHCAEQRLEIAAAFKQSYGEELVDKLQSECGGEFETVLVTMLQDPAYSDAIELYEAMSGAGTTETTLIEVITTKTNEEIEDIKKKYAEKYETELEDDLNGDLNGYFKRLMVSLVCGSRNESFEIDEAEVQGDVDAFIEAGPGIWGTDEASMNKILCQRNKYHLLEFFRRYEERMEGKTVEDTIKDEVDDSLQEGFLAIVETTKNTPRFFAKQIRKCCEGWGTSDNHLIRIIVSRAEVDMIQIKYEYEQLYEKTLEDELRSETGGQYCKMLLALIGVDEADGECEDDD